MSWVRELNSLVARRTVALAAVAGLIAGCGGGGEDGEAACERFRFDRAGWRAPDARDVPLDRERLSKRQQIATAVIECEALEGMTRREVKRLLGEPDLPGEQGWYWELGYQRELGGLDNEQLRLAFDRAGRVASAEIVTF